MRKTQIWGFTNPQIPRFNGCKSAEKTANLEPEPPCAAELENTKAPQGSVTHEYFQPDVSAAVQPVHLIAAMEPVSQNVCRYKKSFSYLLLATGGLAIQRMALSPQVMNLCVSYI